MESNKFMRRKILLSVLIVLLVISSIVAIYKIRIRPVAVSNRTNTKILEGQVIKFKEFSSSNFTSTGLAFDEIDNAFWIGDYGALNSKEFQTPRVVEVNKDLTKIMKTVDLSNVLGKGDNLQGVAWDYKSDSLWLAVGNSCKNITKDGRLIVEFNLGKYSKYKSNGICVDNETVWVLCYSKYLLHYDKTGRLIKEYKFNYKDQDMLFNGKDELLITVGADYKGEENYILSFDKASGKTAVKYQVIGAYAVEGITVVEDKMYIVNDGLYHDAKIKDSYFSIYDLKCTDDKFSDNK